ncbi:hypothetical protein JEQ12_010204 [Ovis aries]|uniref:Uncharacterized protein n=1 Tax=Ovis aries TaxID=9940 RepID=A0A836D6J3_SHEEP|nr:hypothetical protein JEQ12_010204 [Ovis aries]
MLRDPGPDRLFADKGPTRPPLTRQLRRVPSIPAKAADPQVDAEAQNGREVPRPRSLVGLDPQGGWAGLSTSAQWESGPGNVSPSPPHSAGHIVGLRKYLLDEGEVKSDSPGCNHFPDVWPRTSRRFSPSVSEYLLSVY